MAIVDRDQLIAAIAASAQQSWMKVGTTTVAGTFQALWRTSGMPAAAASGPANGSGVALTSSTQGALSIPAPSNTSYLAGFEASATAPGALILYDRIAEWGVNAAVNTSQTMGAVTLPTRATSWNDIELWLEVETALGATQTGNITVNYTDQGAAAGSSTVTQFAASAPIGRAQQCSLAAGDTGVKSVTSIQLTTASTGKFNAVMRKRLATIGLIAVADARNIGWPETKLEQVGNSACLELMWLPQGTTAPVFIGSHCVAQG